MSKEDLSNEALDAAAEAALLEQSADDDDDDTGNDDLGNEDDGNDNDGVGDDDTGDTADDDDQEDLEDEPVDNAARSALGRKVAKQSEEIRELKKVILKSIIERGQDEEEEEDLEIDLDSELTGRDFLKILEHREKTKSKEEKQKTAAEDAYHTDYRDSVSRALEGIDEGLHKDVMDEFKKNHNKRYSDDGVVDATSNIKDAYIAVLTAKTDSKNPFEKNGDNSGNDDEALGTGASGKNPPKKSKKKFKLDKAAADYAAAMGMSQEDIDAALEGEAPSYLGG
jgi:hypothetical protein